MPLEGRFAIGLDEFMLRLGHLNVLASILPTITVSKQRVGRRLADDLVKPVTIETGEVAQVGWYLAQKNLSAVETGDGRIRPAHPKARYKRLKVCLAERGEVMAVESLDGAPVTIWFQDKAIADPRTASKVGAVTVEVREISNKSGVSHLVDWAAILGITNARYALTSHGRVLSALANSTEIASSRNPYVIGAERIAFAWQLFATDGDMLRPMVNRLCQITDLGKTGAIELILEIFRDLQKQASTDRATISSRAVRGLRDMQEDLGLGRGSKPVRSKEPTATAWHRASSRLESLTDLGLLQKFEASGKSRQFDYFYRKTAALDALNESLQSEQPILEILDKRLVASLFGSTLRAGSHSECASVLFDAVRVAVTPTGVHIESSAIAASAVAAARGIVLEIGAARDRIIGLAHSHSELARLSRGYSGTRPEFVSITVPTFERLGPKVFE